MRRLTDFIILLFFLISYKLAIANEIEKVGDFFLIAAPISALALTFSKGDKEGAKQMLTGFAVNGGITYALKHLVSAPRPNMLDNLSFPSGHTSATFYSASFVSKRYGFRSGLPIYAAAVFTGYSRIQSKNHYVRDVVVGAALGWLSAHYFTTKNNKLIVRADIKNKSLNMFWQKHF